MHRKRPLALARSIAPLFALVAACAEPAPLVPPGPPQNPPPPGPTAEPPDAAPTAEPPSTPSAQPSSAPAATASAAATAAPDAAATASASAAPAASAAAASVPAGANLRVGSMTVDGLAVEGLACRAEGLGLLGSMLVVGGIAKKKAALDACAPKGDKPHVEWTAAKGKVGVVNVQASTPAIEACVKKVLAGTPAPFEGECAATLAIGK